MTRGVHTGNGRDWPAERIEKLRGLAAAGLSARQMADKMGMTRNSVLGKCFRLDIPIQRQPKKVRKVRSRPKVATNDGFRPTYAASRSGRKSYHPASRGLGLAVREPAVHLAPGMIDLPAEPTAATAVTIMGLTDTTCRWPLGEPTVNMLYCGAATEFGSYCPFHSRKAYKMRGEPDDRPLP
jgi:GcrA cell cycle regulator